MMNQFYGKSVAPEIVARYQPALDPDVIDALEDYEPLARSLEAEESIYA